MRLAKPASGWSHVGGERQFVRPVTTRWVAPPFASAVAGAPRDMTMRRDPTAASTRNRRVERVLISGTCITRFLCGITWSARFGRANRARTSLKGDFLGPLGPLCGWGTV